jgi:hypothetical protein
MSKNLRSKLGKEQYQLIQRNWLVNFIDCSIAYNSASETEIFEWQKDVVELNKKLNL